MTVLHQNRSTRLKVKVHAIWKDVKCFLPVCFCSIGMGVKGLQYFMDRCCPEACVTVNLREMARQQQASATAPHTSSWVYFCVQPVWQWLCVIHEMVILADSPRSSSFLHWCAWLCKVMWGNSFSALSFSALSFSDVCTIFGFINLLKQWFSI